MAAPFPTPTKKWHTTTYPTLSPLRPSLSAKGKNVLITGGGTGIGAETARYFAAAGASRIALLGRRLQPLQETKASIQRSHPETDVFIATADVTDKTSVDAAFSAFVNSNESQKINILIHAAAVVGPPEQIQTVDPDTFLSAVQTTISGSLHVAQAFLRHMHASENEEAVAIEINSSAAHVDFGSGAFASYSVAKLASFRLWDAIAHANRQVRIYHVQPGVVDTDMNREAGGVKALGFEDHVSLPASFCVWLASPEASFLRNKFLWANWDVDELMERREELEQRQGLLGITLGGWPFGEEGFVSSWGKGGK